MLLFNNKAFSYLEIAISITIVGLLATGGIISLTAHLQSKKRFEARVFALETRNALLAYAKLNSGRLPFVDIGDDGVADENELGDATPGWVPFETLGVPAKDPWGNRLRYALHYKASLSDCTGFKASVLQPNGLADSSLFPQVLETDVKSADPSTWLDDATWTVAFVLVSGGEKASGSNGAGFDIYKDSTDTVIADNEDGSPRFVRAKGSKTFDDLVYYVGEYLYYSKACM